MEKEILDYINLRNNRKIEEFDGLSPIQMRNILNETFTENGIIQIEKEINKEVFCKIPLFQQIKFYLKILEREGEIVLTKVGNLPPKIAKEIYSQGIMKDEAIEWGTTKLTKETDAYSLIINRIIAEISGFTKKRNNKVSLTQKGKKLLLNDQRLFEEIFINYSRKFNWGYGDGYEDNGIIQQLFAFTIYQLINYGNNYKEERFYFDKFIRAFPNAMNEFKEYKLYEDKIWFISKCFYLRNFKRFLIYFNMVVYEKEKDNYGENKKIKRTDIFNEIIKISSKDKGLI